MQFFFFIYISFFLEEHFLGGGVKRYDGEIFKKMS